MHDESTSDAVLLARIRAGEHAAFATLVRRHTHRFYAYVWRMVQNTAQADDIVQDCFLKLWERPDLWDESRGVAFKAWFYRILSNAALDVLRKRARFDHSGDEVLIQIADKAPLPGAMLDERARQDAMELALAALPSRQKQALTLCFYEELSVKDAAQVMNITPKALESLLSRGKQSLKNVLSESYDVQNKKGSAHHYG